MSFNPSPPAQDAPFSLAVRPLTDYERKIAVDYLKPFRYRAVGMAIIGMACALAILFAPDTVLLGVPLLFALIAGESAMEYRRNSVKIGKALALGTLVEITGPLGKKRFGGPWMIGPVSFATTRGVPKPLSAGAVSRMAFLPEAGIALSIDGIPLKKALPITTTPREFAKDLAIPMAPPPAPAPVQTPLATAPAPLETEELPPPPDDWEGLVCGKCGRANPPDAKFCAGCGAPLRS